MQKGATWFITNPNAGQAELRDRLHADVRLDAHVVEASGESDCREKTREAIEAGAVRIVPVGGDGTINEVVNAMLSSGRDIELGIVPVGTGNDLARTLDIPLELDGAIAVLEEGRVARIDAFSLESQGRLVYGVNVSAGGFSGQVDNNMSSELKSTWGSLAYIFGAAASLPDMENYRLKLQWDEGPQEEIDALNIIIANGRTVGGGRRVAPMANPSDGLLDVIIVERGSVPRIAEVAARLMAGNWTESELVSHRRVKSLRVESEPPMWFNVDGDLVTDRSVYFKVLPSVLTVVVGPGYSPVPDVEPSA